jgi:hypothetical protein
MQGYTPLWAYSKRYKDYYDRVENLDHAREADSQHREEHYSKSDGIIDLSKAKAKLNAQRTRSVRRKTKRSRSTYAEGVTFCPQCEKPYISGKEKRCSRCGTKFAGMDSSQGSSAEA